MSPLPKISLSLIKDIIYILSILIAVMFYFRDKAIHSVVIETKVDTIIENQKNILNNMKELDIKFEKQSEINGKVLMYIELDSN
jgi:hypothetical protein